RPWRKNPPAPDRSLSPAAPVAAVFIFPNLNPAQEPLHARQPTSALDPSRLSPPRPGAGGTVPRRADLTLGRRDGWARRARLPDQAARSRQRRLRRAGPDGLRLPRRYRRAVRRVVGGAGGRRDRAGE